MIRSFLVFVISVLGFIISVVYVAEFLDSKRLPQTGSVQCPLGLQTIGCEFTNLMHGPADGYLTAECSIGGSLTFPKSMCVIIQAPVVEEPKGIKLGEE